MRDIMVKFTGTDGSGRDAFDTWATTVAGIGIATLVDSEVTASREVITNLPTGFQATNSGDIYANTYQLRTPVTWQQADNYIGDEQIVPVPIKYTIGEDKEKVSRFDTRVQALRSRRGRKEILTLWTADMDTPAAQNGTPAEYIYAGSKDLVPKVRKGSPICHIYDFSEQDRGYPFVISPAEYDGTTEVKPAVWLHDYTAVVRIFDDQDVANLIASMGDELVSTKDVDPAILAQHQGPGWSWWDNPDVDLPDPQAKFVSN